VCLHREVIYELKNSFVALLCRQGYCVGAKQHTVHREGLPCRCGTETEQSGPAGASHDGFDAGGFWCRRCCGSGWYRAPREDVFVAFRFSVEGAAYCWHQPDHLVTWPYALTGGAEVWGGEQPEKPIALPARRFAEARALIAFVCDNAHAEGVQPR
jgi:hypothetical protein